MKIFAAKFFAIAATALVALNASPVHAQAWPNKPITLVVPFPPGGGTDASARPLALHLSKRLGRPVIIDNRSGAGCTVGASVAATAARDSYTFFIGAVHLAIAPSFIRSSTTTSNRSGASDGHSESHACRSRQGNIDTGAARDLGEPGVPKRLR